MKRGAVWTFLALSFFLVLFPLTLGKPGLPAGLKSDEPAYYLMALSLAYDRDLRAEAKDADRLFQEFPFRRVDNLILMTDDAWQTAYFGKPYLYSLFAAPFARLYGGNGLIAFNMLMLVAMVAMGAVYLSRFNPPWLALLFSAGFFLLSHSFSYVFWLHPEVFNMFGVAACLFLAFHRFRAGEAGEDPPLPLGQAALSGAALALAVYNKPIYLALALPVVGICLLRRQWKPLVAFAGGGAVTLAAAAGLAVALTGHPTSYLGVRRQGVIVCEPGRVPIAPEGAAAAPGQTVPKPLMGTGGAWTWVLRIPEVDWGKLGMNLGYFVFGRHAGLFLYAPFVPVALLLFLLRNRRSREGWLTLAALAAVALFFLVYITENWQGGGGFVGNRYYVCVLPAFLFLVRKVTPTPTLAGYALAGLFVGPILFTPFGAGGPEPTLQSHVRNAPFRYFPLELTLREVPGYDKLELGDVSVRGRRDVFLPQGETMWLRGASRQELWLQSPRPLSRLLFELESPAPDNRVSLSLGGEEQELHLGADVPARLELAPKAADRTRRVPGGTLHYYRLEVFPATGRNRPWTRWLPPNLCPGFAQDDQLAENFFLGVRLSLLGDPAAVAADVYSVTWKSVSVPARLAPGQRIEVPVRLANASSVTWAATGSARVKLAYRWSGEDGRRLPDDGRRAELPLPLAPGAEAAVTLEVQAPALPGRYTLEIEPVLEHVSWFSEKETEAVYRAPVEVASEGPTEADAVV
ncbi:MAG TPA: hypothetical protein VF017_13895 [Thermoanaerobaculia bacterium]|nr:hypothetical protein [Thermoanaerobaculia bacterium]